MFILLIFTKNQKSKQKQEKVLQNKKNSYKLLLLIFVFGQLFLGI